MNVKAESSTKGLVVGVLVLTLVVLGLGGAVVAVKVRPEPLPQDSAERAVVLWQRAIDEDPENASAHVGLGLALVAASRSDEAAAAFQDAMALDDTAWLPRYQLGLLLMEGDPERARSLVEDAARLAPDQEKVAPYVILGDMSLRLDMPKDAKVAYERSLAYDPFTFDGHFGLARAYEALGKPQAALDEYREAGRFDPANTAVAEAIKRLGG